MTETEWVEDGSWRWRRGKRSWGDGEEGAMRVDQSCGSCASVYWVTNPNTKHFAIECETIAEETNVLYAAHTVPYLQKLLNSSEFWVLI